MKSLPRSTAPDRIAQHVGDQADLGRPSVNVGCAKQNSVAENRW